ncbi:MAG TPA: SDR family NAD(P)-dependent oxidoreductase, partial [Chloroflexota bacterium]|nr:SDR family NAD(P)-dependent oxidoreductase [Chloroflexota bacterium]
GADVAINYHLNAQGAQATLSQVEAAGRRGAVFQADMRNAAAARALVERTADHFGQLDILVNNAGITSWGPFLDYTEAAFDDVMDTNLKGSYFASQAAARAFIQQQTPGRIVLVSSLVGVQAVPYLSAYSMTKAGLRMLARSLGLELGRYGITVNALGVGPTVNDRNLRDDPEYDAHWGAVVPVGRAATPEDACSAAVYLCSDEAAYVNGTTLMVDGGWSTYGPTPRFEFVEQQRRVGA